MTIYAHDVNGGFMVGDTITRTACYAYPTSINAEAAKKNPAAIAADMMRSVNNFAEVCPEAYAKTTWANGLAEEIIAKIQTA